MKYEVLLVGELHPWTKLDYEGYQILGERSPWRKDKVPKLTIDYETYLLEKWKPDRLFMEVRTKERDKSILKCIRDNRLNCQRFYFPTPSHDESEFKKIQSELRKLYDESVVEEMLCEDSEFMRKLYEADLLKKLEDNILASSRTMALIGIAHLQPAYYTMREKKELNVYALAIA